MFAHKQYVPIVLLLGIGLALFAACGGSSSSAKSGDDDASPADDDASGCGSPSLIPGTWKSAALTLTIASDLTYHAVGVNDTAYDVYGTIALNGCTADFTDTSGQLACPSSQVGEYTYDVTATTLKTTLKSDPCDGRALGLNGAVFQRQD